MIISDYKGNKPDLPDYNMIYKSFSQNNFILSTYFVSDNIKMVMIKNLSEKEIMIYN